MLRFVLLPLSLALVLFVIWTALLVHAAPPKPFGVWYTEEINQPHFVTNEDGSLTPCLGEDSHQDRGWSGDLQPGQSFTISSLQCDGGQGLLYWVQGSALLSLSVTVDVDGFGGQAWPNGVYSAHAPVAQKGHDNYVQSRCIVQGYMDPMTQIGQGPFLIGYYTMTLTNRSSRVIKDVYLRLYSNMGWIPWQKAYCSQEDWNFD